MSIPVTIIPQVDKKALDAAAQQIGKAFMNAINQVFLGNNGIGNQLTKSIVAAFSGIGNAANQNVAKIHAFNAAIQNLNKSLQQTQQLGQQLSINWGGGSPAGPGGGGPGGPGGPNNNPNNPNRPNRGGGGGRGVRGMEIAMAAAAMPLALRQAQMSYTMAPFKYDAQIGQANAALSMAGLTKDYRNTVADQMMRNTPEMMKMWDRNSALNQLAPVMQGFSNFGGVAMGGVQVAGGLSMMGTAVGSGLGAIIAGKGISRILGGAGSAGEGLRLLTDQGARDAFMDSKFANEEAESREKLMKTAPLAMAAIGRAGSEADSRMGFYRTSQMSEARTQELLNANNLTLGNKFSPEQILGMFSAVQGAGGRSQAAVGVNTALKIEIDGFSREAAAQLVGSMVGRTYDSGRVSSYLGTQTSDRMIGSQIMQAVAGNNFNTTYGWMGPAGMSRALGSGIGNSQYGEVNELALRQRAMGILSQVSTGGWDNQTQTNRAAILAGTSWGGGSASGLDVLLNTDVKSLLSGQLPEEWRAYGLGDKDRKSALMSTLTGGWGSKVADMATNSADSPIGKLARYLMDQGKGGFSTYQKMLSGEIKGIEGLSGQDFGIALRSMAGGLGGYSAIEAGAMINMVRGGMPTPGLPKGGPDGKGMGDGSQAEMMVQNTNLQIFAGMETAAVLLVKALGQSQEAAQQLLAAIPNADVIAKAMASGNIKGVENGLKKQGLANRASGDPAFIGLGAPDPSKPTVAPQRGGLRHAP